METGSRAEMSHVLRSSPESASLSAPFRSGFSCLRERPGDRVYGNYQEVNGRRLGLHKAKGIEHGPNLAGYPQEKSRPNPGRSRVHIVSV
jgi:hypothetical protein